MIRRRSLTLAALAGVAIFTQSFRAAAAADRSLKVGVSAGPYGDILREAAKLAAKEGLAVEVVEFTD
jgi:D-methionine transport system substrate-binding protein